MTLDWISSLHLLGLVQAVFIALLLLHPSRRNRANVMLAALMLTLGAGLWEALARSSGLWQDWPLATGWFAATPFLLGPLLLAYVRRLIGDPDWSASGWALHLAPAILFSVALLPILFEPAEQRIERILLAQRAISELHPVNWAVLFVKCSHILAYLLAALRRLRTFKRNWKQGESDNTVIRLRWLQRLCFAFVGLQLVWLTLTLAAVQGGLSSGTRLDDLALLAVAALVFLIGYWGLSAPVLSPAREIGESNRSPEDRYQTSGLSVAASAELAKRIEAVLQVEQLYLQPRLRLAELAAAVGATPHMTSQAINQHLAGNFYDLINRYRVEAAARRLRDPAQSHLPVERIALDCGFNNRTSFSRMFRTLMQSTPSEYRKARSHPRPHR
jgi:AraC-like DNA-binding protein